MEDRDVLLEGEQPEELTAVDKVLGYVVLLDKILELAILEDHEVEEETYASCRLVNHLWRRRINIILRRCQQHYEVEDTESEENERSPLEAFLEAFSGRQEDNLPPFNLTIGPGPGHRPNGVITERHLNNWTTVLTRCGTGLINLRLDLDSKWCDLQEEPINFPAIPPDLTFPHLESIKIILNFYLITRIENYSRWLSQLVGAVLDGCDRLKSLTLRNYELPLPADFQSIQFPPTQLTRIELVGDIGMWFLEQTLLPITFPKLTSLSLPVPPDDGNVQEDLHRILHPFSSQLEELTFRGQPSFEHPDQRSSTIRLPVMDKVEVLEVYATYYEWAEDNFPRLEEYFPALRTISLQDQTYQRLQRWMERTIVTSVQSVNVTLKEQEDIINPALREESLLQQLVRLKQAFPNVTQLTLEFPYYYEYAPAVKHIFQEMRQLQELDMTFSDNGGEPSSEMYNGLLLGISREAALSLQNCSDIWDRVTLNLEGLTSVVLLTELRKLRLAVGIYYEYTLSLSLDVSMKFAFLEMPHLRELATRGRFAVSQDMVEKWEEEGRILRNN